MKLPEHVALSFLLAQLGARQEFGPAGTALVVAAGLLPDLDGASILGGWRCHRTYHRVVGHSLPVTLFGPAVLAWLGAGVLGLGPVFALWAWLQASLLAHLVTDVLFYRWPVQLLWPFSTRGVGFGLVAWNDLVPTVMLYGSVLLALVGPAAAVAAVCVAGLGLYLACRAVFPRPRSGWPGWITGSWAPRSPRICRWLTGDFIT
jgi:membrane-bound metal-dependent hydrolase YbcI (DUF457 family)